MAVGRRYGPKPGGMPTGRTGVVRLTNPEARKLLMILWRDATVGVEHVLLTSPDDYCKHRVDIAEFYIQW